MHSLATSYVPVNLKGAGSPIIFDHSNKTLLSMRMWLATDSEIGETARHVCSYGSLALTAVQFRWQKSEITPNIPLTWNLWSPKMNPEAQEMHLRRHAYGWLDLFIDVDCRSLLVVHTASLCDVQDVGDVQAALRARGCNDRLCICTICSSTRIFRALKILHVAHNILRSGNVTN